MAYFRTGGVGGEELLKPREYLSWTVVSCDKRTYTSGTNITDGGTSYPHSLMINVKGISGTLVTSGSGSSGSLGIYGLKDGVITTIHQKTNSRSYTGTFKNYDYLLLTAAAGGATTFTFKITES